MLKALPPSFLARSQAMLGEEYPAFLETYQHSPWHGLRVNPLKISPASFRQISPFSLTPVPWCPEGFTYPESERPGKHPYHAAGLYYLQEPSAMAVAAALGAQPGERILDLCAAPGGKSTQLAAAMRGQGLLVSNEIHPVRVKALSENIERLGITNTVVTNETPERLAERFRGFFDRILVDAPCSGEGMFRKLPEAIDDWSEAKVAECQRLQADILESAASMLKPGGTLVYSTCTFAPAENEQSIASFLTRHPAFALQPVPHADAFSPGHAEWAQPVLDAMTLTARLWPHKVSGEGHFIARLVKSADAEEVSPVSNRKKKGKGAFASAGLKEALASWQLFAADALAGNGPFSPDPQRYLLFGEQLYLFPEAELDLSGLKVVRPGLHLGAVKKNRFEPSHALALALGSGSAARIVSLQADDSELFRYLRGETLQHDGTNGWTLVTVDGYPIGWGKQADHQLKNHYPKGLRWV